MKKKIIIICVFLLLIFMTSFFFLKVAIDLYNYDMDPKNGVDIFEGFGAAYALMIGGFIVFYELDLFYTTYYFFIKPKTVAKSILNILANLSLLLILADGYLSSVFMELRAFEITPYILFFAYMGVRVAYGFVILKDSAKQEA